VKPKLIYIFIIFVIVIILSLIIYLNNYNIKDTCDKSRLPIGYTCVNYTIAKVLEDSNCKSNFDCTDKLPFEYAIISSCPYQAICIDNKCNVICPSYNQKLM